VGYFGGVLLPALGFFNIFPFRYSFVADHFQYLAMIGPLAIGAAGVTRAARRPIEPWHRELHATVQRLTSALAARDEGTVTALVPDRGLRGRLPSGLRSEPACDAREGDAGEAISVGPPYFNLTFVPLMAALLILLPAGPRRLMIVETDQDVALLDLDNVRSTPQRPE
ncbi:MAG: cytochrome c-type biogenesis CcmF C-terminal domain-containing protein, partial [Pyrinomonadaceae bacterium]